MSTNNLQAWLYDFNNNHKFSVRLGQHFCNEFIRESWPELYYEEDYNKSMDLIVDFLVHCHVYPSLPNKIIH